VLSSISILKLVKRYHLVMANCSLLKMLSATCLWKSPFEEGSIEGETPVFAEDNVRTALFL
jgi:hypothetical protein